jgi:hypothetical protein
MGLRPCSFTPTFASKLSNQVSELLNGSSTEDDVGRGWGGMGCDAAHTPHPAKATPTQMPGVGRVKWVKWVSHGVRAGGALQFHCYTNYESSGLGSFLPDD